MFLRRAINKNRKDRLDRLSDVIDNLIEEIEDVRSEVTSLRKDINTIKADIERESIVNEDGERVPMSQVINEYLYGKETADK